MPFFHSHASTRDLRPYLLQTIKSCSKVRIVNFVICFSVVPSTTVSESFTNINYFVFTKPLWIAWVMMMSILQPRGRGTERMSSDKILIPHFNLTRADVSEHLALYLTLCISTSWHPIHFNCNCEYMALLKSDPRASS